MYIWIRDKYSSTSFKQRLWRRKIVLIWQINSSNHVCHCGVVVKELLARADKPGSTSGDAISVFLYRFFSCLVSFLTLFFLLAFFLYSYCWPCLSCTWINDILSLSPEFYFGKGISKSLDLHTGQADDQIKTISPVKTCPSSEFFSLSVSWHHDKQHTVHHKLY